MEPIVFIDPAGGLWKIAPYAAFFAPAQADAMKEYVGLQIDQTWIAYWSLYQKWALLRPWDKDKDSWMAWDGTGQMVKRLHPLNAELYDKLSELHQ